MGSSTQPSKDHPTPNANPSPNTPPHQQAHFAMLKHLLRASPTFLTITHDPSTRTLTVHVDRSQIETVGKPALGNFLLRLHIYRCTADVAACRAFYEELSAVDGVFLEWRKIVLERREPKMSFVQANTFLEDDGKGGKRVVLREYEASVEGMVRSWAERGV